MKNKNLFISSLSVIFNPKGLRKGVSRRIYKGAKPGFLEALKQKIEFVKLLRQLQKLEAEEANLK